MSQGRKRGKGEERATSALSSVGPDLTFNHCCNSPCIIEGRSRYHFFAPIRVVITKVLMRLSDESFSPAADPDCEFCLVGAFLSSIFYPQNLAEHLTCGRSSVNSGMNDKIIRVPTSHSTGQASADFSKGPDTK